MACAYTSRPLLNSCSALVLIAFGSRATFDGRGDSPGTEVGQHQFVGRSTLKWIKRIDVAFPVCLTLAIGERIFNFLNVEQPPCAIKKLKHNSNQTFACSFIFRLPCRTRFSLTRSNNGAFSAENLTNGQRTGRQRAGQFTDSLRWAIDTLPIQFWIGHFFQNLHGVPADTDH